MHEKILQGVFESIPELELAYQYGSSLQNREEAKDVDFGILLKTPVSAERKLEIYNDLSDQLTKIFRKEIDIAILNQSGPILTYQVLKKGQLVYGDIPRAKQFTVDAMTRYFDYLPLHQFFVEQLEKRLGTCSDGR